MGVSMKTVSFALILALCAMSVPSYGDVTLIAKNDQTVEAQQSDLPNYDKQINQMDQMSDEISASIFSKKSGIHNAKPSRDGMQVTLVKVRR